VIDSPTEQAWALDARAGSHAAFAQLVRHNQQPLRSFLRRLCRGAAEADDLAQDTFVFAWENIARYDSQRPFRSWLFGIAWRKHSQSRRGWLRLLKRESAWLETRDGATSDDPGLRLDLSAACVALPPEQRAAILLCLGLDFTQEEAAQALALPLGTIKSHIARGRAKLAGLLGEKP
jgi:RNA polymerase sigma factor (sigma-70 family)